MITVISTFRNEEQNLGILYRELSMMLRRFPFAYEIILVDDYSADGSWAIAEKIAAENREVHVFKNSGKRGKGWSLKTGLDAAKGDKIVFLDSDTQDNPVDIPKFLEKLADGADLVNGFRYSRQAEPLIRFYSSFFNWFLRSFYRSPFHDINCGFKAFKKELFGKIAFDPDTFRFFPLAVFYAGLKVDEVKVENRPRIYGKSKFGIGKIFRGFRDFFRFLASKKAKHR